MKRIKVGKVDIIEAAISKNDNNNEESNYQWELKRNYRSKK